jgi:hypothetical protein
VRASLMFFLEQRQRYFWVLRKLVKIYLGSKFRCLELTMSGSRTKLMLSGGKGSNLDCITF